MCHNRKYMYMCNTCKSGSANLFRVFLLLVAIPNLNPQNEGKIAKRLIFYSKYKIFGLINKAAWSLP